MLSPISTSSSEEEEPPYAPTEEFSDISNSFSENRYEEVKIKNIGFFEENPNPKKSRIQQSRVTDYLPGVESTAPADDVSLTDIMESPKKKRGPKKLKKDPEEIQNAWKKEIFNLVQYSEIILNLTGNSPIKPIYICINTDPTHNRQMWDMLRSMNECESFALKYYNENGTAIGKSDEQPLSKANSRNGKISIIILDTVTKIIDGTFVSMLNSLIRKHDAGGAILVPGVGSSHRSVYRFQSTNPVNVVVMENFQKKVVRCEDPFSHLNKRITKIEKKLGYLEKKISHK